MDLSIIVPLYNEEQSLPELFNWVKRTMTQNQYTWEIIFINDGSTDNSWDVITNLAQQNKEIKAISFRRNYGKSAALYCGFARAQGDIVVTMDADLQDSPEEIPEMVRMISEDGFDLVSGWKRKRYDNALTKNIPSKIYNWTARKVTGLKLHDMNCGLKAYKNAVVKNIEVYGDMHRYIPYLAKNAGFIHIGEKEVHHQPRKYGTSKFGLNRFTHGYLDLFSLWFLSKFGKTPMHLFGGIGSLMFIIGLIAVIVVGTIKLAALVGHYHAPLITDIPYFYLALTMMIIGVQMFLTGFLGELISRNSGERNKYTIKEELNQK